jgi:hypothetical protein
MKKSTSQSSLPISTSIVSGRLSVTLPTTPSFPIMLCGGKFRFGTGRGLARREFEAFRFSMQELCRRLTKQLR